MQEEDDGSQLDSTSASTTSTEDTEGSEGTPPWDDELGSVPVLGADDEDRRLGAQPNLPNVSLDPEVGNMLSGIEDWWAWYDRQIKNHEDWTFDNKFEDETDAERRPIPSGTYAYRFWLQMMYELSMGDVSVVFISPESHAREEDSAEEFFDQRKEELRNHLVDLFDGISFEDNDGSVSVTIKFTDEYEHKSISNRQVEDLKIEDETKIWEQHKQMYYFFNQFANKSSIGRTFDSDAIDLDPAKAEPMANGDRFDWISDMVVRLVFENTRIQTICNLKGLVDGEEFSIKLSSFDADLVKGWNTVHYDQELKRVMEHGTDRTIEITNPNPEDEEWVKRSYRYRILRRDLVQRVAGKLRNSIWRDYNALADQDSRFEKDPYLWLAGDLIYLLIDMGWLAASDGDFFDVLEGEEASSEQQGGSDISRTRDSGEVQSYPGMLEFTRLKTLMYDDNKEKGREDGGRWGHVVLRHFIGERQRWMWCEPLDHIDENHPGGFIGLKPEEPNGQIPAVNHQVQRRFHGRRHHYFSEILHRRKCRAGQRTIDALNHLQKTQWEINTELLKKILINVEGARKKPPRIHDELKHNPGKKIIVDSIRREMDRMFHSAWKIIRVQHPHMSDPEKRETIRPMFDENYCDGANRVWHSWFCDWRGRLYPRSTELSPHSMDLGKALIRFKQKLPLGERGVVWLKIHLCNLYSGVYEKWKKRGLHSPWKLEESEGGKKWIVKNFGQRREWSENKDVEERLRQIAENPLSKDNIDLWYEGWGAGRESFQRLAATLEFKKVLDAEKNEKGSSAKVESGLPIHLDASTNAYQHMAALSRDPDLAKLVNITSGEPPRDLYIEVSQKAQEIFNEHRRRLSDQSAGNDDDEHAIESKLLKPPKDEKGTTLEERNSIIKNHEKIVKLLTEDEHCEDLVRQLFSRSIVKLPIMTVSYGGMELAKGLLSHNGKSNGRLGYYWTDDSIKPKLTWHEDSKLFKVFTKVMEDEDDEEDGDEPKKGKAPPQFAKKYTRSPIPNKIAQGVVSDIIQALSVIAPGYVDVQFRLKRCLKVAENTWNSNTNPTHDHLLNWETPSGFRVWNFEPKTDLPTARQLRFRTSEDAGFYYWKYFQKKHLYWVKIIDEATDDEYSSINNRLLQIARKAFFRGNSTQGDAGILVDAESRFDELEEGLKITRSEGDKEALEELEECIGDEFPTYESASKDKRLPDLEGYPREPERKDENDGEIWWVMRRKFPNEADAKKYHGSMCKKFVRELIHEMNSRCSKKFSDQHRIPRYYMSCAIEHKEVQTSYCQSLCDLLRERCPDTWVNYHSLTNRPSRMLDKNLRALYQAWVGNGGEMDPEKDPLAYAAALYQIQQYKMGTLRFYYDRTKPRWDKDKDDKKKLRMVTGLTANFVHSMDAAHLTLAVVEMARHSEDYPDTDIGRAFKDVWAVHDSFGTHACAIDEMREIVRKKFIEVHEPDRLLELELKYEVKPKYGKSKKSWKERIWAGRTDNVNKYWEDKDLALRSVDELGAALRTGVSLLNKRIEKLTGSSKLEVPPYPTQAMKEYELISQMLRIRELMKYCQQQDGKKNDLLQDECEEIGIGSDGLIKKELHRKLISHENERLNREPPELDRLEFSEICDDPWSSGLDPSTVPDYMIS